MKILFILDEKKNEDINWQYITDEKKRGGMNNGIQRKPVHDYGINIVSWSFAGRGFDEAVYIKMQ